LCKFDMSPSAIWYDFTFMSITTSHHNTAHTLSNPSHNMYRSSSSLAYTPCQISRCPLLRTLKKLVQSVTGAMQSDGGNLAISSESVRCPSIGKGDTAPKGEEQATTSEGVDSTSIHPLKQRNHQAQR
jgi:hypothetical protein